MDRAFKIENHIRLKKFSSEEGEMLYTCLKYMVSGALYCIAFAQISRTSLCIKEKLISSIINLYIASSTGSFSFVYFSFSFAYFSLLIMSHSLHGPYVEDTGNISPIARTLQRGMMVVSYISKHVN